MDRTDHWEAKVVGAFLATAVAALLQLLTLSNLDNWMIVSTWLFAASAPLLMVAFAIVSNSQLVEIAEKSHPRILEGITWGPMIAISLAFLSITAHFGIGTLVACVAGEAGAGWALKRIIRAIPKEKTTTNATASTPENPALTR